MSTARKDLAMELIPSASEVQLARDSSRSLAQNLPKKKNQVKIRVLGDGERSTDIVVPASALKFLVNLLTEMAQGNAVTLMPLHAELTTQQAADLLNVSRPFFIKLLNKKKIPFKKVGRHRRIAAHDVLKFKKTHDQHAEDATDMLVSEAQKLKLGYE